MLGLGVLNQGHDRNDYNMFNVYASTGLLVLFFLATKKPIPKTSLDLSVEQADSKNEEVKEEFVRRAEVSKRRKPPLERGISRNKSDPKLLPVANVKF